MFFKEENCVKTARYVTPRRARSPVVSQVDAVGIQHGHDLEDHVVSEDLSHGVLAHQEVNHTYIRRTRGHARAHRTHTVREMDLKRKKSKGGARRLIEF